jgi:sporulation protein YlmC with PRC-barrel domain
MNRIIVIVTMTIFSLCTGIVSAQQSQQAQPSSSGQTGTSDKQGTSSGAGGAAGTSGAGGGGAAAAGAPVAGRSTLGVTVVEMEAVIAGWSAKKDLLGKTVINDNKDKIGKIDDIILTPSSDTKIPAASFAIIGVGGFLGIGKHDVAIPMEQIKLQGGNLVLPGATKDALKSLPKFEYARK